MKNNLFLQVYLYLLITETGLGIIIPQEDDYLLVDCAAEVTKSLLQDKETLFIFGPMVEYKNEIYDPYDDTNDKINAVHINVTVQETCEGIKDQEVRHVKFYAIPQLEGYFKTWINNDRNIDRFIESLHLENQWPIILTPTSGVKMSFRPNYYKTYLIFIKYNGSSKRELYNQLDFVFQILEELGYNNLTGRYVVINLGNSSKQTVFHSIRQVNGNDDYPKSIIYLYRDVEDVKIYSWHPYTPPSGMCGQIREILLQNTCFKNGSNVGFSKHLTFPNPEPDLSCCEVTFEERIGVYFDDMPEVAKLEKNLENYMGMAKAECKVQDRTGIVLKENGVYRDMRDFFKAKYFYTEYYTFFVPLSDNYPRWDSLSRVFSIYTWVVFFITILAVSIVFKYIYSHLLHKRHGKFEDNIYWALHSWGVILGIGVSTIPRNAALRIFFICFVLYSLSINTVFQAFFTTFFVHPGSKHQIDTFEELENYNLSFHNFPEYEYFTNTYGPELANRSFLFLSPHEAIVFALFSEKATFLTSERNYEHFVQISCPSLQYYKFSAPTAYDHKGLFLRDHELLDNKFKNFMSRLVEAGISSKIVEYRLVRPFYKYSSLRQIDEEDIYVPMSLLHLQSVYYFFGMGLLLSTFAFVIEIVVHYFCCSFLT